MKKILAFLGLLGLASAQSCTEEIKQDVLFILETSGKQCGAIEGLTQSILSNFTTLAPYNRFGVATISQNVLNLNYPLIVILLSFE